MRPGYKVKPEAKAINSSRRCAAFSKRRRHRWYFYSEELITLSRHSMLTSQRHRRAFQLEFMSSNPELINLHFFYCPTSWYRRIPELLLTIYKNWIFIYFLQANRKMLRIVRRCIMSSCKHTFSWLNVYSDSTSSHACSWRSNRQLRKLVLYGRQTSPPFSAQHIAYIAARYNFTIVISHVFVLISALKEKPWKPFRRAEIRRILNTETSDKEKQFRSFVIYHTKRTILWRFAIVSRHKICWHSKTIASYRTHENYDFFFSYSTHGAERPGSRRHRSQTTAIYL